MIPRVSCFKDCVSSYLQDGSHLLVWEKMKKDDAGGIGVFLVAGLNSDIRRGRAPVPSPVPSPPPSSSSSSNSTGPSQGADRTKRESRQANISTSIATHKRQIGKENVQNIDMASTKQKLNMT